MYGIPAEYYDVVYGNKNYEREAHVVRRMVAERRPGSQSLLDVACGTGVHGLHLSRYYEVDGIDLNAGFLVSARERNPRGYYSEGDMRDFSLDRMYDIVVCLFSSIGYVRTLDNVRKTLVRCREHLTDGVCFLSSRGSRRTSGSRAGCMCSTPSGRDQGLPDGP